jgi:cobalamin synthase
VVDVADLAHAAHGQELAVRREGERANAADRVAPWSVGIAVFTARCLVLTVAAGARYPRESGTGKVIVEATRNREAVLFSILAAGAICSFPYILPRMDFFGPTSGRPIVIYLLPLTDMFSRAVGIFVMPWLAVIALRKICEWRLGGITGDCLGAAIESAEFVFLLTAALLVGYW